MKKQLFALMLMLLCNQSETGVTLVNKSHTPIKITPVTKRSRKPLDKYGTLNIEKNNASDELQTGMFKLQFDASDEALFFSLDKDGLYEVRKYKGKPNIRGIKPVL